MIFSRLWHSIAAAGAATLALLGLVVKMKHDARKEGAETAHREIEQTQREEQDRVRKKSDEIRRNSPRTDDDLRRRMREQASDREQ